MTDRPPEYCVECGKPIDNAEALPFLCLACCIETMCDECWHQYVCEEDEE